MMKKLTIILLSFLAGGLPLKAQQKTDSVGKVVSFREVMNLGLSHNFNIKLQKYATAEASGTALSTKGYLNPYFTFSLVKGIGTDPTITNDGTFYQQTEFIIPTRTGISFYTGGRIENTNLIQDGFIMNASGAWVGATVPLLRGLGKNSTLNAAIRATSLTAQAAREQLSNEVMSYVRDVLSSYLTLNKSIDNYAIQKDALKEALKYQQSIYQLISKDQVAKVEKDRADELVISKEETETNTRLDALDAYYSLKMITGVASDSVDNKVPVIADRIPDPDFAGIRQFIKSHAIIRNSMITNTPLYKNVALLVKASKIQMDEAKNQKLNQFNLDFRFSKFGMYQNGNYNFQKTLKSNYPGNSYLISLDYTLPLKNQQQKGNYLAKKAAYQSTQTELNQLLFETKTQIQRAMVSLDKQIDLYRKTKKLVVLRRQSYEDEYKKFKLGNSTQINVVLSFNDYYTASVNLNNLKFSIFNTLVQLKYLLGDFPVTKGELDTFSVRKFLMLY